MYQHVPGAIDQSRQVEHLGRRKSARFTKYPSCQRHRQGPALRRLERPLPHV